MSILTKIHDRDYSTLMILKLTTATVPVFTMHQTLSETAHYNYVAVFIEHKDVQLGTFF